MIEISRLYEGRGHQNQIISFPSGVLLLIRQGQWVSTNSILALIGSEESLCEGDLTVQIYRIPYRREVFFEDVSLKKLFFRIKVENFKRKESLRPITPLFSIDLLQRVQTGDLVRWEEDLTSCTSIASKASLIPKS